MHLRVLLGFAIVCGPTAARADGPVPAAPPQVPAAPPQVPAAPPAPQSGLADEMGSPTGEWITSGRGPAPLLGMDVMLGQQTGLRPTLAVFTAARSSLLVEGYYGGLFTKFGASEAAGAGARWVTTRGGRDAVTIGPGVDVLFHFNDGKAVILAPTVDVTWRHCFGERAAFVLGTNAGVGVGMSGSYDHGDPVAGRVTPLISFYTGLRY